MLKRVSLAGAVFCLLAGALSVGGDSARAADGAVVVNGVNNAVNNVVNGVARQTYDKARDAIGQTFRQTFDLRDIVIDAANGAAIGDSLEGSLADFRRLAQLRLLAALDGAASAFGEDMLREHLGARKAEVDLQTGLGGRKGSFGINLIGSFDEDAGSAFGWQLRSYGGEQDAFGANAGVFYRRIDDGMLVGINAFADYEDGDYGGFARYSIGGEVRNAWLGLHANYYKPITDEKRVNMTVAAFSRQGFDAKLRLNAPDYRWLKWAADYYNYDGKRGTKSEDGLRIGAEADITPALNVALFYDDGAEEFGGALSYSHTIGESKQRQNADNFAPDLFAPVRREHSQRIALVVSEGRGFRLSPEVRDSAGIGIVNIPVSMTIGNFIGVSPTASVSIISPIDGFGIITTGGGS